MGAIVMTRRAVGTWLVNLQSSLPPTDQTICLAYSLPLLTGGGGLKCKHPLPQWHGATSLVVHCHLVQFNCTKQNLPVFSAISTFTNKIDVVILLNQVLFYWLIFFVEKGSLSLFEFKTAGATASAVWQDGKAVHADWPCSLIHC